MASSLTNSKPAVKTKYDRAENTLVVSSSEDDDSEMETDSSDESEVESGSVSEKEECKKDIFRLPVMHDKDENSRQKCFEAWLDKVPHDFNLSKINMGDVVSKNSIDDFTPWWEAVSQKKGELGEKKSEYVNKDDVLFDNWFKKSSPDSINWLSGPGSSSNTRENGVADVEDINVPSIYDRQPKPKGRRAMKRDRKAVREQTTGKKWFDMKAPDVDEKTKMDMEIIKMRSVLDPKRFYKHNDRKGLPKYFQMGTVVDEDTDFYSSRLTKKQRKQTLVEELMADANIRQFNKRKYEELQQKHRGKKKFKVKKK